MTLFGLGALQSPPDERDFQIEALYAAAGVTPAPVLPPVYGVPNRPPILNQGQTPMCVAYSTSSMKSYQDHDDQAPVKFWNFDEAAFFKAIGGGSNGAVMRTALDRLLKVGYPVVGGASPTAAHKIAAYYAIPRNIAAIKAAIHTLGEIVLATPWYNCPTPDQRVLTADLRWVKAGSLNVGDELVAFDETPSRSADYQRAQVISANRTVAELFEITTDRGTTVVSGGHPFINCPPKAARHWVRAKAVKPGDRLAYMMEPYEADRSWEAGWMAGFLDGEGSVNEDAVYFGQKEGPTAERAVAIAAALGAEARPHYQRPEGVINFNIYGGHAAGLSLLGRTRPGRLLASAHRLWEGKNVAGYRHHPAEVQNVTPRGTGEIVGLGTTAKTLIVDGFLGHNSWFTPGADYILPCPDYSVGGHAIVADGWNDARGLRLRNSWGGAWGYQGDAFMPYAYVTSAVWELWKTTDT